MRICTLFVAAFCGLLTWFSCRQPASSNRQTFDASIREWIYAHADTLIQKTDSLAALAERGAAGPALQQAFLDCRRHYKRLEWFAEYYTPFAARLLNGPPLPEYEIEETKTANPEGLQVIEELIYPYDSSQLAALKTEILSFKTGVRGLKNAAEHIVFDTAHIFDACRQEVFRILALGITGFDTPLCGQAIPESAVSLEAVKQLCAMMGAPSSLLAQFGGAIATGRAPQSVAAFDFAAFITRQLNPISTAMLQWRQEKGLPVVKETTALRHDAKTLFDSAAINTAFFVHSPEALPSPEKIQLGRELFASEKLAGNGQRSCKSCHQPEKAFTDGLNQAFTLNGQSRLLRNTPTLLYAGLQQAQFYDMRSPTLENQALDVLSNKDEMHSSPAIIAAWLNKTDNMPARFRKAFPEMDDSIAPRQVMMAIAGYVRSLQPFNAAFDRFMRGDTNALDPEAKAGLNLFIGKARCATCHFIPLFNGTAAPSFSGSEAEVLGVLRQPGQAVLDKDEGRFIHTALDGLRYSFKTPTLRNVARTGPYMHNGAYRTLEEVMEFYNKGGGRGYGIDLPNQTLPADSLQLTAKEMQSIIRFMGSLTDDGY